MRAFVSILHNTKENRFHPIYYTEKPLPSYSGEDAMRFKSRGHHTNGLETLDLARKDAADLGTKLIEQGYNVNVENSIISWDGEGIPADVTFRSIQDFIRPSLTTETNN
jgi:hypothetical protein